MNAQTWMVLSTVSYVLAAIMLVCVFVLFFRLDIFSIICDLTGITAARQIKKMRLVEDSTSRYKYDPSSFRHGKKTENIKMTLELGNREKKDITLGNLQYSDILITKEKSDIIDMLSKTKNQTTMLSQHSNDSTTLLDNNLENESVLMTTGKSVQDDMRFSVTEEIVVIHTNEKID